MNAHNLNLDVSQITQAGTFLSRQLEMKMPELLRERRPELWGANGTIIPTTSDLTPGVRSVIEETLKEKGRMAEFYSEEANDFSLVNVAITEEGYKALDIVKAYRYSVMELAADAVAGRAIRPLKAEVAMINIMEKKHHFALFGSERHSLTGFYNNPNVPVSNSGYNPNTASAQDDLDFVQGELQKQLDSSLLTAEFENILVPSRLLGLWARKLIPNTSATILTILNESLTIANGGRPINFIPVNESRADILAENGVTTAVPNYDRLVFLPGDVRVMSMKQYTPRNLAPQLQALDFQVYMYCGQSEVMFHRPLDVLYSDIVPVA